MEHEEELDIKRERIAKLMEDQDKKLKEKSKAKQKVKV